MTTMNKVLFGTGIALLIHAINQFLLVGLQLGSILFFGFAITILVTSIKYRKQQCLNKANSNFVTIAGVIMLLTVFIGAAVIISNISHFAEIGILKSTTGIIPIFAISLIVLIVGIKSKKQLNRMKACGVI